VWIWPLPLFLRLGCGFCASSEGKDLSSWVRISRFKVTILGVDLVFWVLGFGFGACGGSILSWDFEV
jgi:hypothetical protein